MNNQQIMKKLTKLLNCSEKEIFSEIERLVSEIQQMLTNNITSIRLIKRLNKLRKKKQGREIAKQIRKAKKKELQYE